MCIYGGFGGEYHVAGPLTVVQKRTWRTEGVYVRPEEADSDTYL